MSVSAGYQQSLALKSDGTVIAWGFDFFNYAQTTVPVGLLNVVAVSAGAYNSLALKSDGTVVAWGNNSFGQTTIPIGLSSVVAVADGDYHSLALKSDGTVVAWGGNDYGQTNVPAWLSNVVAVEAGVVHSLALKSDGTVVAWGYNGFGETNVPAGLSDVVALSSKFSHSLALKSDGTVVAWGKNDAGQATVPVGLSNVMAVSAGDAYSLALKSDGTVVVWGDNGFGQTNVPTGLNLGTSTKASQTISFGAMPAVVAGDTGTVSATATSGLTVSYTSTTTSICTVTGSTVTGVAAGTCTIAANQAGDASYNAAPQVAQSFTVASAQCIYSLGSTSQSVGTGVAVGNVNVTVASGCVWSAISNASRITITSGASGSGNGSVGYSVAANTSTSPNTGIMTIAGQTFTVSQASSTGSGVNTDSVQRLYLAYFNRPADPAGLAAFEALLSPTVAANQAQLTALAAYISGSPEYAALYAGQTNAQIIDSLYMNLFGRHCESAVVQNTWAGWLTDGTYTFDQIALQLTFSAQGTDAMAIANKLAAATAFTKALNTSTKIAGYSGMAAAARVRAWLATVTDVAATLTAATASVDTVVTPLPPGYFSHANLTWMPVSSTEIWSNAYAYCNNNPINGLTGWRLPTKNELIDLYVSKAMSNQNWLLGNTWSSDLVGQASHNIVALNNGIPGSDSDTSFHYVTCVRSNIQTTLLTAPTGINITVGSGQSNISSTISWNPVSGATSYNIYMATSPGVSKSNYSSLAGGTKISGANSPHTQAGLTGGTTYYFVVTAVNASGESGESLQRTATPQVNQLPFGYVSQAGLTWMPVASAENWTNADAYCGTTTINGQTGWHLPTEAELRALYVSKMTNGQGWQLGDTWSATPNGSGGSHITVNLSANTGYASPGADSSTYLVTCVRTEGVAAAGGYVTQGNLIWMPASSSTYNWSNANAYCANTTINSLTGWRLPSKGELKALYDSGMIKGQGWAEGYTWSWELGGAGGHYLVSLNYGIPNWYVDSNLYYVTCVRTTDVTAPNTTAGPSVSGTTYTTTNLSVTIDENGTGYYLILPATAAVPTVAEVQAGPSFAMSANVAATLAVSGLTSTTAYKIYFVAKDAANNVQTVRSVAVTTMAGNYVVQGGLTWMPVTFKELFSSAESYCNTTIKGQPGWRLPTDTELKNLYKSGAMNGQGWTLGPTFSYRGYWSTDFYGVDLYDGSVFARTGYFYGNVTCVLDKTGPNTTAGPTVSGTTQTTTVLSVTIDEDAATGYYLVLPATAAAPTVAAVQAGTSFAMYSANSAITQTISGLTSATAYRIYFVAKDRWGNVQAAVQSVAVTTVSGYVVQGGLNWTPNNANYAKWADAYALCAGGNFLGQTGWRLPTQAELRSLYDSGAIDGQGWVTTGGTWSSSSSSSGFHLVVTLNYSYTYNVWHYDTEYLHVTCVRSTDVTAPNTTAGPSVSGTTATATYISVTINEAGTGYYLVLPATAAAPTVAAVRTGTSFAMTANVASTTVIGGLTSTTAYKIYFVAKDAANNNVQAAVQSVAVTTFPAGYVSQGGLTWSPNNIGQGATNAARYPNSHYFTWPEANAYCASFNGLGLTGWHLPTTAELQALFTSGVMLSGWWGEADGQGWTLESNWSSTPHGDGIHEYVYPLIRSLSSILDWYSDTGGFPVTCVR